MQDTTAAYKPYADTRRVTAQAVYELISVTAADTATATASSEGPISKVSQTHDKIVSMSNIVATLEPDSWLLDGRRKTPNAFDNGEVGWWSDNQSDENGEFSVPEVLTHTFPVPQSSKGFTVVFDDKANEYATDFALTAYDVSDNIISSLHITDNTSSVCVIDLPSDNYSKTVLEVYKTSKPFRYVRVCERVFGFLQYFRGNDIYSIDIIYAIDPTMQSLPAGQLVLTLNNGARQYNILNPKGIYKYLQTGQGINTLISIGGEEVNTGRYYFEQAKSSNGAITASITAYDKIWALDKTRCNIGTTGTWTVEAAITAVLADSGLAITTVIPTEIGARTVNKCIPKDTTHREALRLIAQAGMCNCIFDRLDRLVFFEPEISTAVDILTADNMEEFPEVTDTGLTNTVIITVRDEYADTEVIHTATNQASDEDAKTLEIDNPLVASADVAAWTLSLMGMRYEYVVSEMGNPAREVGDSVQMADVYGENSTALLTEQRVMYDSGLSCTIKAVTA